MRISQKNTGGIQRLARLFSIIFLVGLGSVITGCATDGVGAGPAPVDRGTAPSYAEVVQEYNRRTERIPRLWASAVVRLRYADEDGNLRDEQGEGHVQLLAPDRLALSVGKLSQTLFWLGCDSERFWWFELEDAGRAFVGRHANLGSACAEPVGLPAYPRDVIELMGVTSLPVRTTGGRTGWTRDGKYLVIERPGHTGFVQSFLDPENHQPVWIKILDAHTRQIIVMSKLEDYAPVELRNVGGFFPYAASRVTITQPGQEGELRISLPVMTDGRRRGDQIPGAAFSFESLRQAHRPAEVVVLDAACPQPALADVGSGVDGWRER